MFLIVEPGWQALALMDVQADTGADFMDSFCLSFSEGKETWSFDDRNRFCCLHWDATNICALSLTSPTDGVSLKMIEDLKAMIDNISQEVALLKEKQALQTGKGFAEEHITFTLRGAAHKVAVIAPYVLMRDAQVPHSNKPTLGREVGGSKQCVGLCNTSGLVNHLGQLMTGVVQCGGPLSMCFPFGYSFSAKPDVHFPL